MSPWNTLFRGNPMVLETRRMWRRFFRPTANTSMNLTAMILAGLVFIVFLGSIWSARTSIPPVSIVIIQTAVLLLVVPATSHGAFAGERERRSWDLLLAAPLTKAQIVAGKFVACLGAIGVTFLFFLLPVAITMFFYLPSISDSGSFGIGLLAELVSISFTVLLCSITLAISARCKRSFSALAGTIGLLVVTLAVFPALLSAVLMENQPLRDTLLSPSPFLQLFTLYNLSERASEPLVAHDGISSAFLMSAIYLTIAVALLLSTVRTLQSEDGDGRFTIRRKHA